MLVSDVIVSDVQFDVVPDTRTSHIDVASTNDVAHQRRTQGATLQGAARSLVRTERVRRYSLRVVAIL